MELSSLGGYLLASAYPFATVIVLEYKTKRRPRVMIFSFVALWVLLLLGATSLLIARFA